MINYHPDKRSYIINRRKFRVGGPTRSRTGRKCAWLNESMLCLANPSGDQSENALVGTEKAHLHYVATVVYIWYMTLASVCIDAFAI